MDLISRYLPSGNLSVLDVGGATGVYSFQLADQGHRVTLLDVVPKHIETARKKSVVTQAWMLPDADERIHDPEYVEQLMSLARDAEDHLAIGQDMLFVAGRKRDLNRPSEGARCPAPPNRPLGKL